MGRKKDETKQEIIWNFDNVVPMDEQIKRVGTFNDILTDIIADYYIKEKEYEKNKKTPL